MEKNKIHYTYITTNLINGKQYVGDHSTNNINDGYLGSGHALKSALKKYGKENFSKRILCICENRITAHKKESEYINEYNTLTPNGYNICPNGGKSMMTDETREKLSKTNTGSTGQISWNKGKTNIYSKETKEKISAGLKKYYKNNPMIGRACTEKTKEILKNINLGKTYSDEINKTKGSPGELNPMFGKTLSDNVKNKIKNKLIGRKLSEAHKENIAKGLKRRKDKF